MSNKIRVGELKDKRHFEKVADWYNGHANDVILLSSNETQSIFLVETKEYDVHLVRVFSIGDNVEISIDYRAREMNIEDIRQLILNYHLVVG